MRSLVSVIIPCYNAERWVGEAIQSALDQTYSPVEVIVVDDGSTDRSLEVLKAFGNKIRWETGPNRGGNAARNRGLEMSHGEWLQYLDADDYLLPDKIARQMEFLAANPKTDIVFSPFTMEYWSAAGSRRELLPVPEPHDPWILLGRWFLPGTGSGIWRKQAILDVGGWNEQQPCCQDYELYLRLLMAGKRFIYCPHGGYVYRQWSENTVCKRNKPEVRRHRMKIKQRAEEFLLSRNELTSDRLWAINMGRFELARSAWQHDHSEALRIVDLIRRSQPGFRPAGTVASPAYRLILRLLGFRMAETIADVRRRFWKRTA
jgi:glycosyltransferase involved in cell wall biosynthesis